MKRKTVCTVMVLLVGIVGIGGSLQEWSSSGQFSYFTSVIVQNPNDVAAVVQVTYATPCDPTTPDYQAMVPAGGRSEINVSETVSNPAIGSAVVTSDVPVVAVQNTLWSNDGGGPQWSANDGGVRAPALTWYLAEGSTYGGYQTYITVMNPNTEPAQVAINYTVPGWSEAGPRLMLLPVSQQRVNVADTLTDWSSIGAIVTSDIPVVAQMSVYRNGGNSSTSTMGVNEPSTMWYLAEGNTGEWSGFETWITVMNPADTKAEVSVSYIADGQTHNGPNLSIAAMTQETFNAADSFPDEPGFTAVIMSDNPVVAVQSMIWNEGRGYDSTMGVTAPSKQWYFPQAYASPQYSSWITVQNVGSESANVSVSYATDEGKHDGPGLVLDPFASDSISLPDPLDAGGGTYSFSVTVTSDQPIVALQGTYWDTDFGSHRYLNLGNIQPGTDFYLPSASDPLSMMGP